MTGDSSTGSNVLGACAGGLTVAALQGHLQARRQLRKIGCATYLVSLLDSQLKLVDFPVPDSLLESHVNIIVNDLQDRLERQGKNLASLGKSLETVREEVRPEAEMRARSHIFLLAVAKAHDLSVTEQEMDAMLRRMAMQGGQDYNTIKDYYTKNNLLFALRDRMLADKGMDEIYAKASVKMIPPRKAAPADADAAAGGEASADE